MSEMFGALWVYLRAFCTGHRTSQPARHAMLGLEGTLVAYHRRKGVKGGYTTWTESCDGLPPGTPIWYPLFVLAVGAKAVERARMSREARRQERNRR